MIGSYVSKLRALDVFGYATGCSCIASVRELVGRQTSSRNFWMNLFDLVLRYLHSHAQRFLL